MYCIIPICVFTNFLTHDKNWKQFLDENKNDERVILYQKYWT